MSITNNNKLQPCGYWHRDGIRRGIGCACPITPRDAAPPPADAERVLTNLPPGSGTATRGDYPANEENR